MNRPYPSSFPRSRARTLHRRLALLAVGLLLAAGTPTAFAAQGDASRGPPSFYNVGFHGEPPVEPGDTWHGARVLTVNPAIDYVHVRTDEPDAFEERARSDPDVRYLHEDAPTRLRPHLTPDDPRFGDQWGYGPAPGIGAEAAWDTTLGSTGVTVAVLDTGLDKGHEDIGNTLQGYDFAEADTDPDDECGHGTHVTGTVGALTGNGVGVAGTAQATIMPLKVLDKSLGGCSGSFSDVADAITYAADQGADVVTMSLGCTSCTSDAVSDAIEYAWSKGVLLVSSAGNSGPCTDCVGFPANHPRVVAVSALSQDGSLASFSSTGPEVELAAPGDDVLSTEPGNDYGWKSGTSMAAPHVAGTAALALAVHGNLSNQELRHHLRNTTVDLGLPASEQGYGAVNAAHAVATTDGNGTENTTNGAPTADVQASCTDLACTLDGTASSDPDGTIASYAWDLGDGSTATGAIVNHTYASDGTYTVTLTVTDDGNATDTASTNVTVSEPATHPLDESFDDGTAPGWTVLDESGPAAWNLTQARSHSAPYSFALRGYGEHEVDRLVSPRIDLRGAAGATLELVHWVDAECDRLVLVCFVEDEGTIEVSGDDGATWRTLDSNLWESTGWETLRYDLSEEAGNSDVRLRFTFTSDGGTEGEGWYLDDVRVTTAS